MKSPREIKRRVNVHDLWDFLGTHQQTEVLDFQPFAVDDSVIGYSLYSLDACIYHVYLGLFHLEIKLPDSHDWPHPADP